MAQTTYLARKDADADFANLTVSGTATMTGAVAFNGGLTLADADTITFGTGSDVTLQWDGTNLLMAAAADDSLIEIGDSAATQKSFDFKIYGNASNGADYVLWDASGSDLQVMGAGKVTLKTAHSGTLLGSGASGATHALGSTADNALEFYLTGTHTTGDMRGMYLRLYFAGAGGSGEAARIFSTINNVSVATGGTVNGAHISIGTSGGSAAVSGAANALRATFGIAAASTNIGGTCSVIQVDTDFDTAVTVPTNFAFLRLTNTNTKKSNNFLRLPNVAAETGGLFCAHTTQAMTHSIKIVSEDGTAYYIMCTNANTNRTEA